MDIHEYQAKKIFRHVGIPILKGGVAYTGAEAVRVANKFEKSGGPLHIRHFRVIQKKLPDLIILWRRQIPLSQLQFFFQKARVKLPLI